MKAVLQITIWAWLTVIIVPLACPSVIEETKVPTRYETVTFNFKGADRNSYLKFVDTLRNKVRSKMVHRIPVTAETVPDSKRFVLVDLKINSEKFITLGIDVTNMYVVGYRDKDDKGKDRANFLDDAPQVAKNNLFEEAKVVRTTGFKGNYPDLERFGGDRQNIELGVNKLQHAIESVYGKSVQRNIEAKFFIVSIQMVSEAARFKYILKKALQRGTQGSYKPDPKAISLETRWDKISKAIQNADASGNFRPPHTSVILKNEYGRTWIVKKVSDIKNDVGLLKG